MRNRGVHLLLSTLELCKTRCQGLSTLVVIAVTDASHAAEVSAILESQLSDAQAATALLGVPVEAVSIGDSRRPTGLATAKDADNGLLIAIASGAALILVCLTVLLCRRVARKRTRRQHAASRSVEQTDSDPARHPHAASRSAERIEAGSDPMEFTFDSGPLGIILRDAPEGPVVHKVMAQAERLRVPIGSRILSINGEASAGDKHALKLQLANATRPLRLRVATGTVCIPPTYTLRRVA